MERLLRELDQLQLEYRRDLPLREHSSFHIGGNADVGLFPKNTCELAMCVSLLKCHGVRYAVYGNATNVVFSDSGYRGAVIFTGKMRSLIRLGNRIIADGGVTLRRLSTMARTWGLCGMEFGYGVPGTLGGGIFMNAGAFGQEMGDVCVLSRYLNVESGEIGELMGAAQGFGYRTSAYQSDPRFIIVGGELELVPGDPAEIAARMEDMTRRRRESQPTDYPNGGSVFKRPEGDSAARLIDQVCHLKGLRVGDAQVSLKHAGFIVNLGNATSEDVKQLTREIRRRVEAETGVLLETEIRFEE